MSYTRHHAIIVTGVANLDRPLCIEEMRARVAAIVDGHMAVTECLPSGRNGYTTFLVCPDGSTHWWPESDEGDRLREEVVEVLEGSGLAWCEVQYGDDEGVNCMLRSSGMSHPN